jgi:L-rhamnonate dehydratase
MPKIIDVMAVHPDAPEAPKDWRSWLGQIAVAVKSDDGLVGYGVGGGGAAGVHVVQTVLRDVLLGRDADEIVDIWEAMYRGTLAFGRKGLAIMAISGADLALWDLKGKREGTPVWALLGGAKGSKLPVYRTLFSGEDAGAAIREARGYAGFKLHLGKTDPNASPGDIVDLVRHTREAVGPDVMLMTDAFMSWDVAGALAVLPELEPFSLGWLEEPLSPDDLSGYARLRDASSIPIAGGEHEFTAAAFKDLIDRRLHTVIQPDVCWCGGLTVLARVYRDALAAGLKVCPHRGCEVWALHAIAALDPEPLAETGRPWMSWVLGQPEVADGRIRPGDEPGFGVRFPEYIW